MNLYIPKQEFVEKMTSKIDKILYILTVCFAISLLAIVFISMNIINGKGDVFSACVLNGVILLMSCCTNLAALNITKITLKYKIDKFLSTLDDNSGDRAIYKNRLYKHKNLRAILNLDKKYSFFILLVYVFIYITDLTIISMFV